MTPYKGGSSCRRRRRRRKRKRRGRRRKRRRRMRKRRRRRRKRRRRMQSCMAACLYTLQAYIQNVQIVLICSVAFYCFSTCNALSLETNELFRLNQIQKSNIVLPKLLIIQRSARFCAKVSTSNCAHSSYLKLEQARLIQQYIL